MTLIHFLCDTTKCYNGSLEMGTAFGCATAVVERLQELKETLDFLLIQQDRMQIWSIKIIYRPSVNNRQDGPSDRVLDVLHVKSIPNIWNEH